MLKRMIKGKLYFRRTNRRRRMQWLDDVVRDLKYMKIEECKEKMREGGRWRLAVEEA
jgi:virulence-associated protein VapD